MRAVAQDAASARPADCWIERLSAEVDASFGLSRRGGTLCTLAIIDIQFICRHCASAVTSLANLDLLATP